MNSNVSASQQPITSGLSRYIAESQSADIPEEIKELGKRHILDTLASIVACRDLEPAELARNFALASSGDSKANATTILGTKQTASLTDAVFASAMTAHGAEINDFIPSAFVQPGPAIVSAAIGLAENRRLSGAAVLRAMITGYELAGRIPKSLGLANLREANIANHGIGPVFGTAAAAASILQLPEQSIEHVLSYCAQQASGCWQWMLDVEHIEKSFVFAGLGARNGMHAVLMVEAGFRGVRGVMDHDAGWMKSPIFRGRDADPDYLLRNLGTAFELHHTAYKRYPVGGPTQPAVEALLDMQAEIDPERVKQVCIAMPGRWDAFRDAAMPALNLRYLTSIILLDKHLDFVSAQSLERMHNDAAVKQLMTKVDVVHDPEQETPRGEPRRESARVRVEMLDGSVMERFVPFVRGFPSHPMNREEVISKALELMTPHLGAERAQTVVDTVWAIETLENGGELAALIAR